MKPCEFETKGDMEEPNQTLMYKILTGKPDIRDKCIHKIWLIMRLTTVIIFALFMQVSASSLAQKISLSRSNTPLRTVIKELRHQSGYNFVYTDELLKLSKPVTIKVKGADLEDVLNEIFNSQPLTYSINKNTITIKEKNKSSSIIDKVIDFFSTIDVKGKVVDERGEPLQGASVKVKGATSGTMTDKEGEFFLKGIPDDAVIVIAYLGYKPQEMKVSPSMGVVKMEPETSRLDEVKISGGYYETTDKLKTGSIVRVTAKDIENQPVTSPLMSLQGRVAGLEVSTSSGAPGSAPRVRIRGTNS
ncbi:MAG: SusC/RagA family TonB-linked outer membrane protein, partial [Pedobacter sp.]